MSATSCATAFQKVAVIDDDRDQAEVTEMALGGLGVETVPIVDGHFESVPSLIQHIERTGADAAVCDNRLSPGGLATFFGAEAIATYFRDQRRPAVLITQFTGPDFFTIQKYRRWIPVVLEQDDASPTSVCDGLLAAWEELRGIVPPERRMQRALIDVEDVSDSAGQTWIDLVIPQWRPKKAVRVAASLVDNGSVREALVPGMLLYADVNIDAETPLDLVFANFELGQRTQPARR